MNTQKEYYSERFWQLHKLHTDYAKMCWQFLIVVNGGGAVATLTYIGAVDELRKALWIYWALTGYVVGIVLVGAALAHQVLKFELMLKAWRSG